MTDAEIDQALALAEHDVSSSALPDPTQQIAGVVDQVVQKTIAQHLSQMPIIPGPPGHPGQDGRNGLHGRDGKDGKDGLNGKDGKDGKPGKTIERRVGYADYERLKQPDGAAQITVTQSGTRPTSGTVAAALNDLCFNVKNAPFNATGDGATDDTTAITTAIAAAVTAGGGIVYFPAGSYKFTSKITVSANVTLAGNGKHVSKLLHAFNGDAMELGSQAGLLDLYMEGQGATFTGKGVVMSSAGAGKQWIHHCKIINFASACIAFDDKIAGSQFSGFDIETFQVSGATGSGNYAITVVDTLASAAVPRKFSHIETGGNCAFSFGGASDLYISDSSFADLAYSANSVGVHIANSRWLNQSACTIQGTNNTVVGCGIAPNITLSGVGPFILEGNDYNGTVTDSSSNPQTNRVVAPSVTYTPTWTAVSVNPAIGNGTITGWWTRNGNQITATISVSMGNTTTFGTGEYSFSLPFSTTVTSRNFVGSVQGLRSGVSYIAGSCLLASGTPGSVKCFHQGGGTAFKETVPHTWAANDSLNITITYVI